MENGPARPILRLSRPVRVSRTLTLSPMRRQGAASLMTNARLCRSSTTIAWGNIPTHVFRARRITHDQIARAIDVGRVQLEQKGERVDVTVLIRPDCRHFVHGRPFPLAASAASSTFHYLTHIRAAICLVAEATRGPVSTSPWNELT